MPILVMAVLALIIFLVMGVMLFGAMMAERRQRERLKTAGAALPGQPPEKPKSHVAHAG